MTLSYRNGGPIPADSRFTCECCRLRYGEEALHYDFDDFPMCPRCGSMCIVVPPMHFDADEVDWDQYISHTKLSHRDGWNAARIKRVFPDGPDATGTNPYNRKHPMKLYLRCDVEADEKREKAGQTVEWFVARTREFREAFARLPPELRAVVSDRVSAAIRNPEGSPEKAVEKPAPVAAPAPLRSGMN